MQSLRRLSFAVRIEALRLVFSQGMTEVACDIKEAVPKRTQNARSDI